MKAPRITYASASGWCYWRTGRGVWLPLLGATAVGSPRAKSDSTGRCANMAATVRPAADARNLNQRIHRASGDQRQYGGDQNCRRYSDFGLEPIGHRKQDRQVNEIETVGGAPKEKEWPLGVADASNQPPRQTQKIIAANTNSRKMSEFTARPMASEKARIAGFDPIRARPEFIRNTLMEEVGD